MRRLTFREFQPSEPVALSLEERDGLALVADLRINPVAGESGRYTVTPGSTIGTVHLSGLAVEIRPKIEVDRLLFLLSYGSELAKWQDASFGMQADESLIEALVPVFVQHMTRAFNRGILQGYRTEDAVLAELRGRVRFEDQMRKRFGLPLPIEVRFDDFTEDILENRLIKAAITALRRFPLRSEANRRALRRFHDLLELVADVNFPRAAVPSTNYTRLNAHYRPAVEWARLILRNASFETRHGDTEASAVLFDMNSVFEEFIRTALREELRLTPGQFPSGRTVRALHLDQSDAVRLEPDLSWWSGRSCRFVGDVKYKRVNVAGIKNADLYQLLAYTVGANVPHGLLVYAAGECDPADHHVLHVDKRLHVRAVDLSGSIESLRDQIRHLSVVVRTLAQENDEQHVLRPALRLATQ